VPARPWDAYAVVPGAAALPQACAVAEQLRECGVSVLLHAAGKDSLGSMKSQFRKADASGARHALVFGADELARGVVSIKPLRDPAAAQRTRALADVAAWAHELRTA
jgi:histidyl-tRNA synthetase